MLVIMPKSYKQDLTNLFYHHDLKAFGDILGSCTELD